MFVGAARSIQLKREGTAGLAPTASTSFDIGGDSIVARKKGGVNKTAAIKDYFQSSPNATPREVASALNEKGLKITPQYVSTIKSKLGLGGGGNGRKAGAGRPAGTGGGPGRKPATSGSVAYESLVEAKKFVQSVGDVERARRALDAYASLAR